jgi:hypothetical protein
MGPEMTSRIRSKCAIGASVDYDYQDNQEQSNCQIFVSKASDKEQIRGALKNNT